MMEDIGINDNSKVDKLLNDLMEITGIEKLVVIGSRPEGMYLAAGNCTPTEALGLYHYGRIACEIECKEQVIRNRSREKATAEILAKAFGLARKEKPVDEVSSVPCKGPRKGSVLRKNKK